MTKQVIIRNNIESMIYNIRGKQVMLDSDLSKLYECANGTKDVNKAVKRNAERFPKDFYFQLTSKEYNNLKFQIGTSSLNNNYGGVRKLPYVFTEQGIAMLSSVLRTEKAAEISINIMRTFVEMRKFINANTTLFERVISIENKIDNKFNEYDENFQLIFDALEKEEELNQKIFFDGQIYDAHSLVIDIIKRAKTEITIIDNYIDKSILDLLLYKRSNVIVNLITKNKKLTETDINKFQTKNGMLNLKISNKFHDRFIMIDSKELYHIGASLKDLGNKCFAVSKIEDKNILKQFLEYI